MSFRLKIKNKIIAVLFAILPAFVVGSLVFGANVYYDLDSNAIKTFENNDIAGILTVTYSGASTALTVTQSGAGYAAAFIGGNVGIGTASPTEKLTIKQDSTGNLLGLYDGANNTALAINDSGQTTFKPTAFDYVYNYDGTAAYTDNTAEAKTSVGTAFTILALEASSNDEFYLGLDHPFNTVYFDIATAGAGVTLSAQYYVAAWTALTLTADNTANLTTDGTVTFTAPADWATTAINGQTKYWVRFRSPATSITTAPTAYSVSPTTGNRFYVYGQSGDASPALYVNDKGNVGIGTASPAQSLSVSGNAILTGTMGINNAGVISGRGINYSSSDPSQTTYGMYNSLNTPASNYDVFGIYNSAWNDSSGRSAYGIYNTLTNSDSGGSQSSFGIYNSLAKSGGGGAGNTMYGVYNTITGGQTMYGLYNATTMTYDIGSDPKGYGVYLIDGDSAGGTNYGLYVNIDDPSTTNYSVYVAPTSGNSYFGSNVGIGIAAPAEKLTVRQDSAGNILGLYDGANNTTLAINDSGQTTFKPTAFDTVYTFDGAAAYADNTAEAKTSGGTAFAILALEASSNDEFYLGLDHPFNTVYFDIATAGAGVTLSAQYYVAAWTALTLTADNTANLTTDGTVTFTAPADWATTAINGQTKYWVRFRSPATSITTAPTAYSVSPTTGNRFYVYGQSGDTSPALYVNDKGYVGIGTVTPGVPAGNISAGAKLDVNGNQYLRGDLVFPDDQTERYIRTAYFGGAIRFRSNLGASSDRDLQFGSFDNGNTWYPKMTILSQLYTGVGIDDTSPDAPLEVVSNGGFSNVFLLSSTANADGDLLTVKSTGNVGIGIATPTEKLTIRQDSAGNLLGLYDGANNTVLAINDGGQTTFKPTAFDYVYNYDGTATYTDNTTEAKTSAGTAFTILALETSDDEFYVGLDHPFNTVYFDIATAGVGVTLSAQYYVVAWTALTLTADNTANLTTDGTVTFTAPADWAATAINGQTKYWVRFRSPATSITTAPTAYSVSPTTGNRFYVYGQSGDTAPALYVNDKGNLGIGTAAPSAALTLGADKSLRITGGTSFPGSPSEGEMFFRTDTYQLYAYANSKWQADRTTATKIVAANDSQNKEKADYVADGTNDEVDIENAVAALPSTGGVIYLLDGTYNIGTSIDITKSNVSLIGAGKSTILKLAASANTSVLVVGDGGTTAVEGIIISQIQVDGNKANNATGLYGIYFNNKVTKSRIEKVWAHDNKSYGILFSSSSSANANSYNTITQNDITANSSIGIRISQYSDNNLVSNNNSSLNVNGASTYGMGIWVGGSYNTISNNNTRDNQDNGITLGSTATYNTVSGNTLYSNSEAGMWIGLNGGGGYNTVTGNTIVADADYAAIYVDSAHNTITGNFLSQAGTADGIYLRNYNNSDNNIISSNRIVRSGSGNYGINVAGSTAEANYIIGNEITGSWTGKINDSGTGTTIQQRDWFEIESARTSGTLLSLGIPSATTLAGALVGANINLSSNLTATGQSVTGQSISLPAVTNTGAGTYNYKGLTVTGGALVQNTGAGIDNWTGMDVTMPNITQTTGTVTSIGLKIIGGTVTSGTSYGLIVDSNAGNIGIGTVSPQQKLTLGSASNFAVEMTVPASPSATPAAGGTLAAATYYYKATALDGAGETTGSSEVSCTVDGVTTTACQIDWTASTGAASYRVYGRATGAQDQYWTATTNTYTDTGTAGTAGTVPTTTTSYVNKLAASGNSWVLGGNLGIGTATPNQQLELTGNLRLPATTATTGIIYAGANSFIHNYGVFNTAVGIKAGNLTMTGVDNIFIGYESGNSNATGGANIFVGDYAGRFNDSGNNNTYLGYWAGYASYSGSNNAFIGYLAGRGNTTGSSNAFIGYLAGRYNQTGSYNVFLGQDAGRGTANYTAANNNVVLGYQAGYSIASNSSNNILIGYQAGDSITSASDNTIIGYQAGQAQTTATRNTFLGYQAGYVNTASDNTFIGYQAGDSVTSGGNNTFIGVSAGQADIDGYANIFIGKESGYSNSSGYSNIFLGNQSGYSNTVMGANNTFIGNSSGYSNDTGNFNTFIGNSSGYFNTTGHYNLGLGYATLHKNQTGSANTAIGIGAGLGVFNNSFSNNSLFGYNAGYGLSTGSNNILLGYQAGDNLTTGASNIVIGYDIDAPLATSANTLNIGNLLFGTGIDGTGTTVSSGNVGIGTTTPGSKLTVAGSITLDNTIVVSGVLADAPATGTCAGQANSAGQAVFQTSTSVTSSHIFYNSTRSKHARITSAATCVDGSANTWQILTLTDSITGNAATDSYTVYNPAGDIGTTTAGFINNLYAINGKFVTATVSGGFDIAEEYQTNDESMEAGDTVSIDPNNPLFIAKSSASYDKKLLGIISTNPGLSLGNETIGAWRKVALSGRVATKVSLENGPIETGDYLTSSSEPGVAMRATEPGMVVGMALEAYDGSQTSNSEIPLNPPLQKGETKENPPLQKGETERFENSPVETGTVMVFVNPHWSIGHLTDDGLIANSENNNEGQNEPKTILDQFTLAIKASLDKLGLALKDGVAQVKEFIAGKVTTKKLCIEGEDGETICVEKDQLKELLNKSNTQEAPSILPAPVEENVAELPVITPAPEPPPIPEPEPTPIITPTPTPSEPTPEPTPEIIPAPILEPELTSEPTTAPAETPAPISAPISEQEPEQNPTPIE